MRRRIICMLGALFTFVVGIVLNTPTAFLLLCSVSIVFVGVALIPSFRRTRWEPLYPNIQETADGTLDLDKVQRLIQLINAAVGKVYLATGEFHPYVFNSPALARALLRAVGRGVDVRVIMGDRARAPKDLEIHLWQTNPRFLEVVKDSINTGNIVFLSGRRENDHFHVIDRNVIVEERHEPNTANTWHCATNTWYLGDHYSAIFFEMERNGKRQLTFPFSIIGTAADSPGSALDEGMLANAGA